MNRCLLIIVLSAGMVAGNQETEAQAQTQAEVQAQTQAKAEAQQHIKAMPLYVAPVEASAGNTNGMDIPDHPQLNALRTHLRWIATAEADLNGDGRTEQVGLIGLPPNPRLEYYQLVYLICKDPTDEQAKVTYIQGGHTPSMILLDVHGDPHQEILVRLAAGRQRMAHANYYLYDYETGQAELAALPKPLQVQSRLLDDCRICVELGATRYDMDATQHKLTCEQTETNKSGQRATAALLQYTGYNMLYPVDYNGDGVPDLKGAQLVYATDRAHPLAIVQSIWTWAEEKWVLLHTDLLVLT